MIDLSDGLASDAALIGAASRVLLEIDLPAVPVEQGVEAIAGQLGLSPAEFASTGGEDYELCFCIAPGDRLAVEAALPELRWIGRVCAGPPYGAVFRGPVGPVELTGYVHLID